MRKSVNVLILSAGRRVELVNCFKHARDSLGISGQVVAVDCSQLAPALYFADINELVPRISSGERYVASIIDICNHFNISLIVPTIDTELILLSHEKARIESETGARVLISSEKVISNCRNKVNTQKFLEKHGFGVPRMYTEEELAHPENISYPVFIKPVDGSSSVNAYRVDNPEALTLYRQMIDRPIVQEFIEGTEYTIDTFLDFNSKLISCVPRVRIATRSGEIAKGEIVRDREIMRDVERLMSVLKPIGHITTQCMKTVRGIEYIEINPRFGGGAPMSIMAGADSCEFLYRLMLGEELEYTENYRDNITFLRFDQSIMLNEDMKREFEYEGSLF